MSALVWCPFPDRASADKIAATLLDEKLIACANMFDGVQSLFQWGGEKGEGVECGVLLKTHEELLERLVARLEILHPYDCPAIMGWRCDTVGASTGDWLAELLPSEG